MTAFQGYSPEMAQGVQGGPRGVRRRTPFWTDKNVNRVRKVFRSDCRLRIQQIADTLSMFTFAVFGIVTVDLQMLKVCEKLEPEDQ